MFDSRLFLQIDQLMKAFCQNCVNCCLMGMPFKDGSSVMVQCKDCKKNETGVPLFLWSGGCDFCIPELYDKLEFVGHRKSTAITQIRDTLVFACPVQSLYIWVWLKINELELCRCWP